MIRIFTKNNIHLFTFIRSYFIKLHKNIPNNTYPPNPFHKPSSNTNTTSPITNILSNNLFHKSNSNTKATNTNRYQPNKNRQYERIHSKQNSKISQQNRKTNRNSKQQQKRQKQQIKDKVGQNQIAEWFEEVHRFKDMDSQQIQQMMDHITKPNNIKVVKNQFNDEYQLLLAQVLQFDQQKIQQFRQVVQQLQNSKQFIEDLSKQFLESQGNKISVGQKLEFYQNFIEGLQSIEGMQFSIQIMDSIVKSYRKLKVQESVTAISQYLAADLKIEKNTVQQMDEYIGKYWKKIKMEQILRFVMLIFRKNKVKSQMIDEIQSVIYQDERMMGDVKSQVILMQMEELFGDQQVYGQLVCKIQQGFINRFNRTEYDDYDRQLLEQFDDNYLVDKKLFQQLDYSKLEQNRLQFQEIYCLMKQMFDIGVFQQELYLELVKKTNDVIEQVQMYNTEQLFKFTVINAVYLRLLLNRGYELRDQQEQINGLIMRLYFQKRLVQKLDIQQMIVLNNIYYLLTGNDNKYISYHQQNIIRTINRLELKEQKIMNSLMNILILDLKSKEYRVYQQNRKYIGYIREIVKENVMKVDIDELNMMIRNMVLTRYNGQKDWLLLLAMIVNRISQYQFVDFVKLGLMVQLRGINDDWFWEYYQHQFDELVGSNLTVKQIYEIKQCYGQVMQIVGYLKNRDIGVSISQYLEIIDKLEFEHEIQEQLGYDYSRDQNQMISVSFEEILELDKEVDNTGWVGLVLQ